MFAAAPAVDDIEFEAEIRESAVGTVPEMFAELVLFPARARISPLVVSAVLAIVGVVGVLASVALIFGAVYALLGASLVCLYASFVLATHAAKHQTPTIGPSRTS